MKSMFVLAPAAFALAGLALPAAVATQQRGVRTSRADSARETAALRARIGEDEARVGVAERSDAISRARATELRRQLARTRSETAGRFVGAAEIASHDRALGAIDVELDGRGVALGYGNDMLPGGVRSYGDDMLPSAEMAAFQHTHARLRYRNARIDFDRRRCAVYEGIARDGRVRRERLLSASGRPICTRP